jgi:hypothetical protein
LIVVVADISRSDRSSHSFKTTQILHFAKMIWNMMRGKV